MRGALGRARVRAKGVRRFSLTEEKGGHLFLKRRAGEVGLKVWGELD